MCGMWGARGAGVSCRQWCGATSGSQAILTADLGSERPRLSTRGPYWGVPRVVGVGRHVCGLAAAGGVGRAAVGVFVLAASVRLGGQGQLALFVPGYLKRAHGLLLAMRQTPVARYVPQREGRAGGGARSLHVRFLPTERGSGPMGGVGQTADLVCSDTHLIIPHEINTETHELITAAVNPMRMLLDVRCTLHLLCALHSP